jgi:vesicle coat complex subunit
MIGDANPMVVANAVAALSEIQEARKALNFYLMVPIGTKDGWMHK